MPLKLGQKAPDFSLPDASGKQSRLSDFAGKWVFLYFYPKDDTPGCTKEACAIRDDYSAFKRLGVKVIGVSVDSEKSHDKFRRKYDLPFLLLSDKEKEVVLKFGVWGKKKFMGREYLGTLRQSFLIGPDSKIRKIYTEVKPETHALEVLGDIKKFLKEEKTNGTTSRKNKTKKA